jgi:hypothetical protein
LRRELWSVLEGDLWVLSRHRRIERMLSELSKHSIDSTS